MQAGDWQGWVSPFRLEHRVRVSILRGGKGPALRQKSVLTWSQTASGAEHDHN